MLFKPEDDGITHINVYSKGKTELGRFLTNFAFSKIQTIDGEFNSIEGYWYWLSCKDDRLRSLFGFKAKQVGRELGAKDWINSNLFKNKIKAAILYKICNQPKWLVELQNNRLPLTHYYCYGDKVVDVPSAKWIVDYLMDFCEKDHND